MVLVHMVRHVLLGAIAPPLVWLGASVLPEPRWLSRRTALGQLMTNPATSWLAATLIVIGWRVPAAFDLAQRSALWHIVQDGSFFVTGLLFWWPVVRPWPAAERLAPAAIPLYLFAATLPCDALSAFLVFCDRVVYDPHLSGHGHFNMSALADQQAAGAFMWVSITFLYMGSAIPMTVRALSPDRRSPDADGYGSSASGPKREVPDAARFATMGDRSPTAVRERVDDSYGERHGDAALGNLPSTSFVTKARMVPKATPGAISPRDRRGRSGAAGRTTGCG